MPPVLTMSSGNYDYDYDTVQPYFLDGEEEEEFYPPPCSEDMWKKFELSPSRRPSEHAVPLSDPRHLEAGSDLLDHHHHHLSADLLQSFIIQDCMWSSSFAAAAELERAVSRRGSSLRGRQDSSDSTKGHLNTPEEQEDTGHLQDQHTGASDCMGPSAVVPVDRGVRRVRGHRGDWGAPVSPDSAALSSSDSESDEEEEPAEEEEEEEVDVDVMKVERRKVSCRSADVSPFVLKRSHVNIQQHNYAAPGPAGKRRRWSPRSDGLSHHGDDRRRSHNVLERQRRNELKMSFLALRDQVPAVAHNQKAAKVQILKEATGLVEEMKEEERRMTRMKDKLRKRSRRLQHRLEQLRTLHQHT